MKQDSFLELTVTSSPLSSMRKAGTTNIYLPHDRRIVILSNWFFPDHDRSLAESVFAFLQDFKPSLIVLAGRMIHDRAFQLLAPGAMAEALQDPREPMPAPEVVKAKQDSEIWEQRVIDFGKTVGKDLLMRLLDEADVNKTSEEPECKLVYLPALQGMRQQMPPESNIPLILERVQKKVDAFRRKSATKPAILDDEEPDTEYGDPVEQISLPTLPALPLRRDQFAELLGVKEHPRIRVLTFGSAINLIMTLEDGSPNTLGSVRIEVGRKRVMHPIAEAFANMNLNRQSTILGYPANLSNGWMTTAVNSGLPDRVYWFFSQIGGLFKRSVMDFGDSAQERYASGFFAGWSWRGSLHGKSFPYLSDENGLRSTQIYSVNLREQGDGDRGPQTDIFVN